MNPRLRCFCDAGPSTRLADVTPSRLPGGRLAAKIERPSGVRVATKPGLAPDAVAAMRTAEGMTRASRLVSAPCHQR